LSDIGTRHGNDKLDAMLQHVSTLFKLNTRRTDWVARWNEHLFAIGFCDNNMIRETMARLHQILEESPFAVVPGEMRSPIVTCGVCEHTPGLDLQKFYEMARDAMRGAENAVNGSERARRVVVVIPDPIIDPELKAIMDK
jgi:PleD family two-component response regulator